MSTKTFKVVVASDVHLDHLTAGYDRFEDLKKSFDFIVDHACTIKADLFLFCGDLCDPDNTRCHRSIAAAVEAALLLAKNGVPSRWLTGNHDVVESGGGDHTLMALKALASFVPLTTNNTMNNPRMIDVYDQPDYETLVHRSGSGTVAFIGLPFTAASHGYDVRGALNVFTGVTGDDYLIVAGHLHIPGLIPGSETKDMPRGREVVLPTVREISEILKHPLDKLVVINGHFHTPQVHDGIIIPGSLDRLTFGEESTPKSFTVIEVPCGDA
jgi:DNA repair exonuclease SbcCD nuclease subunit